jgi:predicted CXXCH cytochrome family protein
MLYGTGAELANGFVFTSPAPLAEGIALNSQESRTNHTAYKDGWSEWCGNCHGSQPHRDLMSFEHPLADEVGDLTDNYNSYNGPASPTGGNYATAYIPELPVEDPQMTVTATRGASSTSRITCLTCHRAHATSAPRALRWDANVLRLREDGVVSGSYRIPDPYNDPEQRALCIKCHYQEARQHGMSQPCMSCHRHRGKSAP